MDQQYGTNIDMSVNTRLEGALRPLMEHIDHEQQNILPVLESRLSKEGTLSFSQSLLYFYLFFIF